MGCEVSPEILRWLADHSRGDLRYALNTLEYVVLGFPVGQKVSPEEVKQQLKKTYAHYDARESDHYDCISAYIKSMRGCDPDAAVYWLSRMLNGGEDPLFVARRMVIFASEDVGLADSRALNVALDVYRACEIIGMPECRLNLVHGTVFLSLLPKSNSAYMALQKADALLKQGGFEEVPPYLRSHPPADTEEAYRYGHDYPQNVTGQKYWSEREPLYVPKPSGAEENLMRLQAERGRLREERRSNPNL
jgi:putative ATPase